MLPRQPRLALSDGRAVRARCKNVPSPREPAAGDGAVVPNRESVAHSPPTVLAGLVQKSMPTGVTLRPPSAGGTPAHRPRVGVAEGNIEIPAFRSHDVDVVVAGRTLAPLDAPGGPFLAAFVVVLVDAKHSRCVDSRRTIARGRCIPQMVVLVSGGEDDPLGQDGPYEFARACVVGPVVESEGRRSRSERSAHCRS